MRRIRPEPRAHYNPSSVKTPGRDMPTGISSSATSNFAFNWGIVHFSGQRPTAARTLNHRTVPLPLTVQLCSFTPVIWGRFSQQLTGETTISLGINIGGGEHQRSGELELIDHIKGLSGAPFLMDKAAVFR